MTELKKQEIAPSQKKYFGTDGIRGHANSEPMTAQTVLKVAMAAARYFKRQHSLHRPKVVIGKDTRLSGYMIENAMTSGFVSMGMDVIMVGPMPTPAVAMLTRSLRADLGVMISASHNPYEDNGVKLFGADGFKLTDTVELEIERRMDDGLTSKRLAKAPDIGRAKRVDEESGRYVEFVKATFPKDQSLHGMRIVVDCANGAAYKAAPKILWELGAEVIPLGVNPNGTNINLKCGATDTRAMQDAVVAHGADIGLALDGDADRLIVADESGRQIDGDQIMAALAIDWQARNKLKGGGIVSTVMSNLGLERFLNGNGLKLERSAVGDRYVMDKMRQGGYNLGGEQSGHFIPLDYTTTGDGLLTALQVLTAVKNADDNPVSDILHPFEPVPQKKRNIRYKKYDPLVNPDIQSFLKSIDENLSDQGRVLVRKSGTEPVIRVMVEGDDEHLVDRTLDRICGRLADEIEKNG